MSWQDFLNNLIPEESSQDRVLFDKLFGLNVAPDISWYPGSGRDLTPLMLDVPGNPTQRRLLRTCGDADEPPLLFWMNDCARPYGDYPEGSMLGHEYKQEYPRLWEEYHSTATFGPRKERYRFHGDIRITLFTVTVRNNEGVDHWRGADGDEYLVCFAYCESEKLLKEIFVSHSLHISRVSLIKQSGYCDQHGKSGFANVPRLIAKEEDTVGKVDLWVLDADSQSNDARQNVKTLSNYVYVGGPLPWGRSPARIYARPGFSYLHEKRTQRIGKSWSR